MVTNTMAEGVIKMKKGIHPDYKTATIRCTTCGNTFESGSVKGEITVDTCSNCHPFYTGEQKFGKAAGRVEKFNKRYGRKSEDK
jgi:large subunit ribosomal protein L31